MRRTIKIIGASREMEPNAERSRTSMTLVSTIGEPRHDHETAGRWSEPASDFRESGVGLCRSHIWCLLGRGTLYGSPLAAQGPSCNEVHRANDVPGDAARPESVGHVDDLEDWREAGHGRVVSEHAAHAVCSGVVGHPPDPTGSGVDRAGNPAEPGRSAV